MHRFHILNRRAEYWAIRSSAPSIARTANISSRARLRSFVRSLTRSRAHGKEVYVYELKSSISNNFDPTELIISSHEQILTVKSMIMGIKRYTLVTLGFYVA